MGQFSLQGLFLEKILIFIVLDVFIRNRSVNVQTVSVFNSFHLKPQEPGGS